MVSGIFEILDENVKKNISKKDYKYMKKPEYVYRFEDEIREMNGIFYKYESEKSTTNDAEKLNEIFFKMEEYRLNEFLFGFLFEQSVESRVDFRKIAKYYNIIPFTPWVMINISPDWNCCEKRTNGTKVKILKKLVEYYLAEEWFEKWEFVIENGSQGNMIHCHLVAKMNTKRLKSVESHLRRGNHTQQLKKYSKKFKGMEGMIKGTSVQKVFVRTEEILKDKLDYLQEEKKPPGHKNLSVIVDGFTKGEL